MPISKILVVCLKYSYGNPERGEGLNNLAIVEPLRNLGYEVEVLWIDKYLHSCNIDNILISRCHSFSPDIVFFKLFREEISTQTLMNIKNNYFTVNWFGDDQWRFDHFTSKYANCFDACITTDKFSINKYYTIGQCNVIKSQHASFSNFEDYHNVDYQYDVSFVGSCNSYRKWVVDYLRAKGFKIVCFGYGWENGAISYEKMSKVFRNSKINLNLSNSLSHDIRYVFSSISSFLFYIKQLLTSHSKIGTQVKARNFEIPIRGGFELTEYVPSLEDYFTIGTNIACYSSIDDLVNLIDYYLTNDKEREQLKHFSVRHARNNHTYQSRIHKCMIEIHRLFHTKNA